MKTEFKKDLIAPCGINCGLCVLHLRDENKCEGCNSGRKVNGRLIKCGRKLCKQRKGKFCFECDHFPCDSMKRLDKRYREHYDISPVENLEFIHKHGMDRFLECQSMKYFSKEGIFCVHDKKYYKHKDNA